MELIDFLVANGEKQEVLAELLPLQEEAESNPAIEKRLAHLFLIAGSASRAAVVYHAIIQQNPRTPKPTQVWAKPSWSKADTVPQSRVHHSSHVQAQ